MFDRIGPQVIGVAARILRIAAAFFRTGLLIAGPGFAPMYVGGGGEAVKPAPLRKQTERSR